MGWGEEGEWDEESYAAGQGEEELKSQTQFLNLRNCFHLVSVGTLLDFDFFAALL